MQVLLLAAALAPALGGYMAWVDRGERVVLSPLLEPVERLAFRALRVDPEAGQG